MKTREEHMLRRLCYLWRNRGGWNTNPEGVWAPLNKLFKHNEKLASIANHYGIPQEILQVASYRAFVKNDLLNSTDKLDKAEREEFWRSFCENALRLFENNKSPLSPEGKEKFRLRALYEPEVFFVAVALLLREAARIEGVRHMNKMTKRESVLMFASLEKML